MRFFKSTDATGDQYVCEFAGSENVAVGKKIIKTTEFYSKGKTNFLLICNYLCFHLISNSIPYCRKQ